MRISDLYSSKKTVISFEIFPPKKDYSVDTIYETIDSLRDLKPDFISVTYGAGGSTKDKTIEIASIVKNKYGIEALAHLTCVSLSKDQLANIINDLKDNSVENILALRGDFPQVAEVNFTPFNDYTYASDLVRELNGFTGIDIGGACYPEGHLECGNAEEDIRNLKTKVDAGTNFLISQLFFNNDLFYSFKEKLIQNDIDVPISAGIMPVVNKKQIERMISLCGASLPQKFIRIIDKYEHNPQALKEAGIAYATEQIIDLLSWGVEGIHLYTMNKPEICRNIMRNISSIRFALEQTG